MAKTHTADAAGTIVFTLERLARLQDLLAEGWSEPDAVCIVIAESKNSIDPRHRKRKQDNRKHARLPRRGGKLPTQADLLREWESLAQSKTPRQANSVLYHRYPDVQPKAIREKLARARKNKFGT